MTDILLRWRREGDLEVLYLGEIAVGRVHKTGGRRGRPGWMFNLAGPLAFWHGSRTLEHARSAVTHELNEWLNRAGLGAHP